MLIAIFSAALSIPQNGDAQSTIPGPTTPSPSIAVVQTPETSDQTSSVQLIFDGGFLNESPRNCGHWHLREHVVTRLIDKALRSTPSRNIFSLNGVTSFDHSVVSINASGGLSGITDIIAALNVAMKSHNADMASIITEESVLVGLEQQNHPHVPKSLAPLFAATPPAMRAVAFGNCFEHRPLNSREFDFGPLSQIIILTAAPADQIRKIPVSIVSHARSRGTNALSISSNGQHSFFYSDFGNATASIDSVIGTVAFWYAAAAIEGHAGSVNFVPVGVSGVQVGLRNWRATESRFSQIAHQLREGNYRTQFDVALSSAHGLICRIRNSQTGTAASTGERIALDPWYRLVRTSEACAIPGRVWASDHISSSFPFEPAHISALLDQIPGLAATQTEIPKTPMSGMTFCGLDNDPAEAAVQKAAIKRYLLMRFRFERAILLNVEEASAGSQCTIMRLDSLVVPIRLVGAALDSGLTSSTTDAHIEKALDTACMELSTLSSTPCALLDRKSVAASLVSILKTHLVYP